MNNKKDKTEAYNADVTKEDLKNLRERNENKGDDAQLKNREHQVDFTGKDLDIPGRTTPSNRTGSNKLKDEENQLYSQGSGHNDHLEDAENHEQ